MKHGRWFLLRQALMVLAVLLPLQVASAASRHHHASHHASHHAAKHHHHAASHHAARHHHAAKHHRTAHYTTRHHHRVAHHATKHHHHVAARDRPLIVIDPGHGGTDPGAIGVTGTKEKTVTLATAKQLKWLLVHSGRYRVLMTRKTDTYVSLADRLAFAKRHHAALLISIHADSSKNHHAHGASVYVRSWTPSGSGVAKLGASRADSSKIARLLAHGRPPPPGSAFLQYTMIDNLTGDIQMRPHPARQEHLYVLADRAIPGVLVEMGFLSNHRDESLLGSKWHRLIIARAIRDAIDDYFKDLKQGDTPST